MAAEERARFVVQRHRATADHFDFRIEVGDVLVSWAVPKGLTLDPRRRRLAVKVGDHALDYFDFEGVIPKSGDGSGDVIVWDVGTYAMRDGDDAAEAVKTGDLHLDLFGEKLRGRFALVRRGPQGDREQWLVVHKNDEHAVPGWEPLDHPESVLTGRTNDEVLAAHDPDPAEG